MKEKNTQNKSFQTTTQIDPHTHTHKTPHKKCDVATNFLLGNCFLLVTFSLKNFINCHPQLTHQVTETAQVHPSLSSESSPRQIWWLRGHDPFLFGNIDLCGETVKGEGKKPPPWNIEVISINLYGIENHLQFKLLLDGSEFWGTYHEKCSDHLCHVWNEQAYRCWKPIRKRIVGVADDNELAVSYG